MRNKTLRTDQLNDTTLAIPILSEREGEVLIWIAYGKTNSEIAIILSLSESSVRVYIERAKDKLKANNKRYAATLAVRLGLISLEAPSS